MRYQNLRGHLRSSLLSDGLPVLGYLRLHFHLYEVLLLDYLLKYLLSLMKYSKYLLRLKIDLFCLLRFQVKAENLVLLTGSFIQRISIEYRLYIVPYEKH